MLTQCTPSPVLFLHKPHRPLSSALYVLNSPSLKTRLRAHSSLSQSPQIDSFWGWLTEHKAVTLKSPIRPAIVSQGLGLVAQRDIAKNEVILELPKKLWINPDMVSSSEIGSACRALKPWVSVALFLIRENLNPNSFWRDYLDILPESTDSTLYWSDEELAEIHGTQLLRTTMGAKEFLKREFEKVREEVLTPNSNLFPSNVTLEDFIWAFGILRSRSFSRLRGENLLLLPLADLINHDPEITTEESYEMKGGGLFSREMLFSLRSPVSVKAGDEVRIQYDLQKTNGELALDYGFVEATDRRNSYTLTLQISESDPFYGDKLDIAEANKMGETAEFDVILGEPLPPLLLPYIRLIAIGGSDAFLLESIFRNSIWGHLELPISRGNEELICRVLQDACSAALAGYQTTIEEVSGGRFGELGFGDLIAMQDEELRENGGVGAKKRIAVEVRLGEKKVLKQIMDAFREREEELDVLEYYQERRLKDLGLCGEQGEIIFWEK